MSVLVYDIISSKQCICD